jgi:hypothetical protein
MKNTPHTRIIDWNGHQLYVEFDYFNGEVETNSPQSATVISIYYNNVDVTSLIHHNDMDDIEDLIVDEFAEDFYYLNKPC